MPPGEGLECEETERIEVGALRNRVISADADLVITCRHIVAAALVPEENIITSVAEDLIRSKAARDHDEIGPGERRRQRSNELLHIVADDRLHPNVAANCVEPLGDDERVGVETERRQHLAADRY